MAELSNNGSAGGGAGEGAGDSAVSSRRSIRNPGTGSPAGMYGPFIGSGEVLDILQELRETYPEARIHLDIIGADGLKRAASTYSVTSFDFDQVCEQYGQGEYRVRVQAIGQPKPVKMFKFLAAAPARPSYAPPPLPAPAPAPVYPQQVYYPAPPPAQPAGTSSEMMQFIITNMQAQQNMVTMLLGKLIEQRTAPQEPAKISELKEMFQLAKQLSRGGSSKGDDSGGGSDELLAGLGKMIIGGLSSGGDAASMSPRQAARPVAAQFGGVAPPRVTPGAAPRVFVAPRTQPHPNAAVPVQEPTEAPPLQTAAALAGEAEPQAAAAPQASEEPLDPATQLIAQALRGDSNARRLAKLIMVEEHDDADAIAAMADGAIDDASSDAFMASEPGGWSRLFVAAFPELTPRRELVQRVESSLRELLSDEGDEQDQSDDHETDDSPSEDQR